MELISWQTVLCCFICVGDATIYVGNMPYRADIDEIKDLFPNAKNSEFKKG